ncbi:MAG: 5-formyltetrahydrofolate cyclo-ligase [Ginsengibacter sp.]
MNKSELRLLYKKKRAELSSSEIARFNDLILIQFQKLSIGFINCVHTYLPSMKLREPDTALIIRYLEFTNPELKVAVPSINKISGILDHYYLEEQSLRMINKFGIEEVHEGEPVSISEIDLVLVPMLAFDNDGYRVGYGKGYYDKFLSLCRADTLVVGLSFFAPEEKIDDRNEFDIALNFCITPSEIFNFNK